MTNIIQRSFGVEAPRDSEAKLRDWLQNRIGYMLDHETDLLLSTLYRLDIDEYKIKQVLQKGTQVPVATGLAELVLDRQRERHLTKQEYVVDQSSFYWGEEE